MSKNSVGPAFPTPEFYDEKHVGTIFGMTLRDYFAGQALANATLMNSVEWAVGSEHDAARTAYIIADAMLKERAK
jgi:hypothetical protein